MADFLLDRDRLEQSSIVANSTMNRGRRCVGSNSYSQDLGLNPIELLTARLQANVQANSTEPVRWLDLCCGSGRALIEAAQLLPKPNLCITGIDLVDAFLPQPIGLSTPLELTAIAIQDFQPDVTYDLITCVHGLHYVGDKLEVIRSAITWLKPDGLFVANFDVANLKNAEGASLRSAVLQNWKSCGLVYQPRRHLLRCEGVRSIPQSYHYLGADDQAGPNYTGQPVVDSYYGMA
jgi:ubiquinone/menaquinone biosynthesis C-methylase UbiE